MIEFLQPLVDTVSRALPAFTERRKQDAVSELGVELFLVYVQLNEALVVAEEIVTALETYLDRIRDHLRTGHDKYALTGGSWVEDKVRLQLENLFGIRQTMDRWSRHLQILDGQAVNELNFLLEEKYGALRALSGAIADHRLPLGIGDVVLLDERGVLRMRDNEARFEHLNDSLTASSVRMDKPWGPEVLQAVEHYFARQRPRERMAEIRSSLESIRQTLEANFSLTDVLMRVGDPRLRRRPRS